MNWRDFSLILIGFIIGFVAMFWLLVWWFG
jgi:hypothetical protein